MSNTNNIDVDLVYIWVDGSDPEWIEKRNLMLEKTNRPTHELKGRYENNDELKYSLRSIEKHAPWIRNIFIITDNQTPIWIDTNNPRVKIIDHKDILPPEALPCFNSSIIEYFIYKAPGLSEHFLYANDDTFLFKDVVPSFFFKDNKYPYVRLKFNLFQKFENILTKRLKVKKSNYRLAVENAISQVKEKNNHEIIGASHHNIDSFLKSFFKEIVESKYAKELKPTFSNHFRDPSDIHRTIISHEMIINKVGFIKYVNRKESLRIKLHRDDFMKFILKYNPKLFCLNDTEHATDEDRARVKPFLKTLFPEKSSFEK